MKFESKDDFLVWLSENDYPYYQNNGYSGSYTDYLWFTVKTDDKEYDVYVRD